MCRLDHLGGRYITFHYKNSGFCAIMDHKGKHNSKSPDPPDGCDGRMLTEGILGGDAGCITKL